MFNDSHYVYTQGLLTGSKVKVLGTSTLLLSVNYYDSKGRVVQNKSDNHLGGTDIENLTYSFTDQVLSKTRIHAVNGQTTTIVTTQSYDHMGRKIQSTESINCATPVILSKLTYSETGQLMDKEVHSTDGGVSYLNKSSYTYNPRNWLKIQTNTQAGFNMALSYEDGTIPQYNGSISNQNYTNGASSNTFVYQYDKLDYHYNRNLAQKLQNNRLRHVKDYVAGSAGSHDLASQVDDNFGYDAIGNLTKDEQAGITAIDWNVYGKIKSIVKTGGNISYSYDAGGNRVSKTTGNTTTYYVRDAQGNSLAVYEKDASSTIWKEQQLYGSSRLGMWKGDVNLATGNASTTWGITGLKFFELSNHLGNVMAVITDKREPLPAGGYGAEVVNAQDYYAFGSIMPGREWKLSNSSYRYGFNGQENDNDIAGTGNHTTALYWEYDTRIGRRWNLDPVKKPWQSDYSVMSGNPIWKVDPNGDDDFFNSDGTFSHSTKSGHLIKIMTARGTLTYSQLNANNAFDKQALDNVTQFYYNQLGVGNSKYVGVGFGDRDNSLAFTNTTDDRNIYVNANYQRKNPFYFSGISPQFDNYNNLKNTLVHERLHASAKDRMRTFGDHAEVYVEQIKDASFKNTTDSYKLGQIGSALQFLFNARMGNEKVSSDSGERIQNLENSLNKALKSSNIAIKYDTSEGPSNTANNQYLIFKKNKLVGKVGYEKKEDVH